MCKNEWNFEYFSNKFIARSFDGYFKVWIKYGQYPDIFVEHIPEMDLIGFLCNFGGLLGMWLGFSLFGVFNDIFILITKIAYRKYINLFSVKANKIKINLVNYVKN